MNNIPLGMDLIPLDSWHRAQDPPGVGFRIYCLAVVEYCSGGLGVQMPVLSVVMKRVCRVMSSWRLSAETPPGTRDYDGYHLLSDWSKLAFSLPQR